MTIDVMKQALAALEDAQRHHYALKHKETDELITALRAAIEQAQEPVAFNHDIGIGRFKVVRGAFWWHVLIGDSPTEHGKFRSRAGAEKMAADLLREFRNGAFVQHTAPRQWQGLTDEEIKAPIQRAMQYFGFDSTKYSLGGAATVGFYGLVKEIEAKLREKNNG